MSGEERERSIAAILKDVPNRGSIKKRYLADRLGNAAKSIVPVDFYIHVEEIVDDDGDLWRFEVAIEYPDGRIVYVYNRESFKIFRQDYQREVARVRKKTARLVKQANRIAYRRNQWYHNIWDWFVGLFD
ncbi:MAG: hypothetical protein Q7S03_04275 [bacterium]|nr:hypothetical protein [bacterium]